MSRTVTQAQKRNAMTDHFPDWPNCTLASSINKMGPPRDAQELKAQKYRTSMSLEGKTYSDGSWYNKMYFYGPNLEFLGTLKVQRKKVKDSNPPVYNNVDDMLIFTHKDFKIPRIIFPYTAEGANQMYNAFLQEPTKLVFVEGPFRKLRTSSRDFRPDGEEYASDEARKKYQRQQLYRKKRQQQRKAAAAAAASAPPPAMVASAPQPAVPAVVARPAVPAVPAVQRKQTKVSAPAPVISNNTPSYTSGKTGTPRRRF